MSIEGLPLEELEKNDEFKKMKEDITQMDDKCRELLMYVADNRSESENKTFLDIPLGRVSSRKSNCIKKLANLLNGLIELSIEIQNKYGKKLVDFKKALKSDEYNDNLESVKFGIQMWVEEYYFPDLHMREEDLPYSPQE